MLRKSALAAIALAALSACVSAPAGSEDVKPVEPPSAPPSEPSERAAEPASEPAATLEAGAEPGAFGAGAAPALESAHPARLGLAVFVLQLAAACATLPPPEPVAAADTAPGPGTALPAEPARARPASVDGERVLGARVASESGDVVGYVVDLLIDPPSGEVAGLVVSIEEGEAKGEVVALDYDSLAWAGGHPAAALEGTELGPEAPALVAPAGWSEPGGAGGTDVAALFDAQTPTLVQGELVSVEPFAPGSSCLILKVRDADNLLHRVLVGAAPLVGRLLPELVPGTQVAAEAVLTRDAKGKVWVASTVGRDGRVLRLRDASGALDWEALTAGLVSARGIRGTSLRTPDGELLALAGWELDPELGRVTRVHVEVGGTTEPVDWTEIERGGEVWQLAGDALRGATGTPVPAGAERTPPEAPPAKEERQESPR